MNRTTMANKPRAHLPPWAWIGILLALSVTSSPASAFWTEFDKGCGPADACDCSAYNTECDAHNIEKFCKVCTGDLDIDHRFKGKTTFWRLQEIRGALNVYDSSLAKDLDFPVLKTVGLSVQLGGSLSDCPASLEKLTAPLLTNVGTAAKVPLVDKFAGDVVVGSVYGYWGGWHDDDNNGYNGDDGNNNGHHDDDHHSNGDGHSNGYAYNKIGVRGKSDYYYNAAGGGYYKKNGGKHGDDYVYISKNGRYYTPKKEGCLNLDRFYTPSLVYIGDDLIVRNNPKLHSLAFPKLLGVGMLGDTVDFGDIVIAGNKKLSLFYAPKAKLSDSAYISSKAQRSVSRTVLPMVKIVKNPNLKLVVMVSSPKCDCYVDPCQNVKSFLAIYALPDLFKKHTKLQDEFEKIDSYYKDTVESFEEKKHDGLASIVDLFGDKLDILKPDDKKPYAVIDRPTSPTTTPPISTTHPVTTTQPVTTAT